jgi:hypothetical protein
LVGWALQRNWWGNGGVDDGQSVWLVAVALALRREGETTGFIDVEEMALKFGKWWQSFVIEFGSTDVGVKTLVGCGVEGVIAAATDGSFD